MKLFDLFKKENTQNQELRSDELVTHVETEEEISSATKVKVVAALMIVGFSTYIAYWVQSPVAPTEFKADVLDNTQQSQPVNTQDSGFTQQVAISNFNFSPAKINVEKGTTVVWTNKDSVSHTITGVDFSSPTLNAGDTFSYKFNDDATVDYHCTFHPQMLGTVVVGTGAANTQGQTQATSQSAMLTDTPQSTSQLVDPIHQAAVETQSLTPPAMGVMDSAPVTEQTSQNVALLDPAKLPADSANHAASYEDLGTLQDQAAIQAEQDAALQAAMAAQAEVDQKALADVKHKGKIADSGPEDILYFAIFGLILYLNRKKFLSATR